MKTASISLRFICVHLRHLRTDSLLQVRSLHPPITPFLRVESVRLRTAPARASGLLAERECALEAREALAAAVDVGGDVDPDLARVDQGDVDARLGQGAEGPGGDAGVGTHADAQDRELGD